MSNTCDRIMHVSAASDPKQGKGAAGFQWPGRSTPCPATADPAISDNSSATMACTTSLCTNYSGSWILIWQSFSVAPVTFGKVQSFLRPNFQIFYTNFPIV